MMKNLRIKQNILLIALSLVVWLGVCCLAMHWNTVYDGAVGSSPMYLWVYAPISLAFAAFDSSADRSSRDNTRLWQALSVYIITFLLYMVLSSGIDLRYKVSCWWLALLLVIAGVITLCGKRITRALKDSSLRPTAYTIFLLYLSYAIAQLGMIAVLHPVSVDEIIRTGQAAGGQSGEYVGRLTSDTDAHPLGTYVFADSDNNYYYYDVVSGAFIKKQSIFDHLADIYE